MPTFDVKCKDCDAVLGSMTLARVPDPKELPKLGRIGRCEPCQDKFLAAYQGLNANG